MAEADDKPNLTAKIDEDRLNSDLTSFCQKALELGADEARIIPAGWVEVDERVRLKCSIPPCPNFRRCANCPPFQFDLDTIRKAFNRYSKAIIFKNNVPVEDFKAERYYPHGQKWQSKSADIASQLEGLAFSKGYCYAVGFGSGSCRDTLCSSLACAALDSGRCAHLLKARPSIEAMGVELTGLLDRLGWKLYPIYRSFKPEQVPCGTSIGLTFIA
jgi:predicted metal-binding protein